MLTDPFALFVVLAGVVVLALKLEQRFATFRSLGAALVGILLGMVLSNLGLIPGTSATYDFLHGTGVSLGIVLILVSVDVRSVVEAGPGMLAAFGIGALGSAIGAVVAGILLAPAIGEETWKLTGQFTGTYVGGGMNFAALALAFDTSSHLFTAAIAADVILTAIWMAACLLVPALLGRPREQESAAGAVEMQSEATLERRLYESGGPVSLSEAAALVALASAIVWGAGWLEGTVGVVPGVLWLTTLSLALGQVPSIRRLRAGAMVGNYLVLLFLAANGAQSVIANIVEVGPAVFYFASITVACHGFVLFGLGRLAGLDLGTLAVASQANVGGAASAMALASARGYADRLLPGVAVGLLGYAVGNYLGYAVGSVMRLLLPG